MVGPKRPDASVCWCLTYRLSSEENRSLAGPARADRMRQIGFEAAGFVKASDTKSVLDGFPRVLMRKPIP